MSTKSTKKGAKMENMFPGIEWPKEWDRNEGWPGQHAPASGSTLDPLDLEIEQLRRHHPELFDRVLAEMKSEAVAQAHQQDPVAWEHLLAENGL